MWTKGPMPAGTWGWGAVVPAAWEGHTRGFLFADFHGDHVVLADGKKLRGYEIAWFNNSIQDLPKE